MVNGMYSREELSPVICLFLSDGDALCRVPVIPEIYPRGPRGGGEGVQGGAPPPRAELNHIHLELQKCTTLTHSAYTFVIMSENR